MQRIAQTITGVSLKTQHCHSERSEESVSLSIKDARRTFEPPQNHVSSLKRVDANRYMRRHTNRLISTTTVAIINVAASNTWKCPESLAWLIVLPNPGASITLPWKWKYSAMMLAFHAPPDAVTNPVTK